MASQNVLQLLQQTGSADTSSVLYAVKGGNTDTGLPLSVLFNAAHLTAPVVTGGSYTGGSFANAQISSPIIAGGSADNISIGGLTPGAGSFTTLSASGTVSGAGFTTFALKSGNLSQFASTTSAQLASIISDETGSGALVFAGSPTFTGTTTVSALTATGAITPSQTVGVVGTTTNNNANTGAVGEFMTVTTGPTSLTSTSSFNAASLTLSAGDWEVWGNISYTFTGVATGLFAGISLTSNTLPASPLFNAIQTTFTSAAGQLIQAFRQRVSVASGQTVFLVGNAAFAGTSTGTGIINARRIR